MSIERITPDRVAAAYAKCGMKPIRHTWIFADRCCALTAIAIAENGADKDECRALNGFGIPHAIRDLPIGDAYRSGFTKGYDDPSRIPSPYWVDSAKAGFEDGRAVAIRMGFYTEPRP